MNSISLGATLDWPYFAEGEIKVQRFECLLQCYVSGNTETEDTAMSSLLSTVNKIAFLKNINVFISHLQLRTFF